MSWIKEELAKTDRSAKALRRFGHIVGIAFLVLGGLLLARYRIAGAPISMLGVALVIFAFIAPKALVGFHFAWTAVSLIIGFVMTHVILTAVFFLLVTPIGVLQRAFRKSPLELAFRDGTRSYWQAKVSARPTADYERQF